MKQYRSSAPPLPLRLHALELLLQLPHLIQVREIPLPLHANKGARALLSLRERTLAESNLLRLEDSSAHLHFSPKTTEERIERLPASPVHVNGHTC